MQQLEALSMYNRSLLKRDLRTAIFSYLEDDKNGEGLFALLVDLKSILEEEESILRKDLNHLKQLRHFLFSSTFIGESNETEAPSSP